MKFFDLELNGLAAGLGRASGNGAVTDVSWVHINDGANICSTILYTNGKGHNSCMNNSMPGEKTTGYRPNEPNVCQKFN